ncbi:DUF6194 family protein [Actinoplanes sp. NPDC024001]|uniref:DUF6194 family protein n=1 Tax=Actinoplanes sp. NPDC024001 TaxID=3154598 RepID=UPI0033DF15E4
MAVESELRALIRSRAPRLLALGEPTHLEPAFPRLRNEILDVLIELGFRSVVLESDRVAGLAVDDFVRGRRDTVDLASGLSHGLGHLTGNRDLVARLRTHNEKVPEADQVSFHGFDAPLEMMSAASPARYLRNLCDYLGEPASDVDRLAGDEGRWSDPAAQLDPARSIGRSPEAAALRVRTDDLLTLLYAQAPRLIERTSVADWHRARVNGIAALGLLRHHAVAADPAPAAERTSRMLAVRDALMAQNLLDILEQEHDRGPTLVFAHNRHLQAHPSRWKLAGMDLEWFSAGATVAAVLGSGYVFVAGSLGASPSLGLADPEPGSFEASLSGTGWFTPAAVRGRPRVTAEPQYFPLDPETIERSDAIMHVSAGDDPVAETAARILSLPGVSEHVIEPGSGMPDYTWGDRFFFAGADRKRPFATIVRHDVPDFDTSSQLDRPGVYRLNIELGRAEFRRAFGFGPEEFAEHRDEIDFTVADRLVPHPAYAVQGWGSVVNPGPATAAEVERLLEYARSRSAARQR